jgi:hypothetical protein
MPTIPLVSPDKQPPVFSRHQNQNQNRTSSYESTNDKDVFQDAQETLEFNPTTTTPDFTNPDGFVVIDSPNSKAKSKGAPTRLPPPIYPPSGGPTENLIDENDQLRPPSRSRAGPTMNRVKTLPTPPVGPVLPDFEDLMVSRKASRSPALAAEESGNGGVKRKPSMVKKMRDRMVK